MYMHVHIKKLGLPPVHGAVGGSSNNTGSNFHGQPSGAQQGLWQKY